MQCHVVIVRDAISTIYARQQLRYSESEESEQQKERKGRKGNANKK